MRHARITGRSRTTPGLCHETCGSRSGACSDGREQPTRATSSVLPDENLAATLAGCIPALRRPQSCRLDDAATTCARSFFRSDGFHEHQYTRRPADFQLAATYFDLRYLPQKTSPSLTRARYNNIRCFALSSSAGLLKMIFFYRHTHFLTLATHPPNSTPPANLLPSGQQR